MLTVVISTSSMMMARGELALAKTTKRLLASARRK
jgi:hypothetical protein